MKIVSAIIAAVLIPCGTVSAGDYIRLGIDSIPAGATNWEIPFYVEHTCPIPWNAVGISHGFVMTGTGGASWSYVDFIPAPHHFSWFSLGGLLMTSYFDDVTPDSFLVGGAGWPSTGMPYTPDTLLFTLVLDIGPSSGQILVDSALVGTNGVWKWSGMTCGLGGAPDRPLFLNKRGWDVHPVVITVYEPMCGDANLSGAVDIDDPIYLVNYVFLFGPAPNPILKSDCDCSGGDVPVDIDDIVHLMDYIFRGGPAPCDTDGDGVPDC
jgi:hypothetical protein